MRITRLEDEAVVEAEEEMATAAVARTMRQATMAMLAGKPSNRATAIGSFSTPITPNDDLTKAQHG